MLHFYMSHTLFQETTRIIYAESTIITIRLDIGACLPQGDLSVQPSPLPSPENIFRYTIYNNNNVDYYKYVF